MTNSRKLKLGFILHGVGRTWNDWRHPRADPGASTSFDFYKRQAQLAERGKFDFLFVADRLSTNEKSSPHYLNRFEPISILSGLAAVTSRIGLVGTLTVIGRNSNQSASDRVLAQVRSENLTIRQIAQRLATPRGAFIGTPGQVADQLQQWFENEGADGYVMFESLPGQLDLFVEKVVPILQARGLYREDYEGETFREHLGLDYPVNRYTAGRKAQSAA